MNNKTTLPLAFYKGTAGKHGAIQLNISPPFVYCKNCKKKWFDRDIPPSVCTCGESDRRSFNTREGAIFVEAAPTISDPQTGKFRYDWDNQKVRMAWSIGDCSTILCFLEGQSSEINIFHDPGAGTSNRGKVSKSCRMNLFEGKKISSGCQMSVSINDKENDFRVTVPIPLRREEVKRLAVCLRSAIPTLIGWQ